MNGSSNNWPYDLAVEGVRALAPYQPGKPIEELERELGISESVKLASNENPCGPSPAVIDAISQAASGVSLYPDGNVFALKNALASHHSVDSEWITVGNGSNDVLIMLAEAFIAPGSEVIFSEHAFAVYPIATQAAGGVARVAAAREYGTDLDAMWALVNDNTRLVFIANPNNPTGTWLAADTLRDFIGSLPEHVIAVVDEAYFEFVGELDYPDTSQWVEKFKNLVVTRTFSKAYGLAGLRVGYGISRPEIADLLNRVRQPFNVNSIAQVAAMAALADTDHLSSIVENNHKGLRQIEAGLTQRGISWIPSVGNFICAEIGDHAMQVYDRLLHHGVIVRPVANYDLPRHLRVSIGTTAENEKFLLALDSALADPNAS